MIDIHCHLLDETGCGAQDFAESLAMCRQAASAGVRTIVAAPRWDEQADAPPLHFEECERKLERLRAELNGALILRLGFMLRFRADLPVLLARYGASLALGGGRHVLVSLPSVQTPREAEDVWENIWRQGYGVVVSRPECSPALRREPSRLGQWVAGGVKLQLDAASLTGAHGRAVQGFALRCVREYMGSVMVASNARDAHSGALARMALAREALVKNNGARSAQLLFNETPSSLINSATDALRESMAGSQTSGLFSRRRGLRPQKTLLTESQPLGDRFPLT